MIPVTQAWADELTRVPRTRGDDPWFGEGWYAITDGNQYWKVRDKKWPTTDDNKWLPFSDEKGIDGAVYYKWDDDLLDVARDAYREQLNQVGYIDDVIVNIEYFGNGDEPKEQD